MKSVVSLGLGLAVLVSFSSVAMAQPVEKVQRTDRVVFYKTAQAPAADMKRVQRTDRIAFNVPAAAEQPSLQPKRIARTDRVIFNKI